MMDADLTISSLPEDEATSTLPWLLDQAGSFGATDSAFTPLLLQADQGGRRAGVLGVNFMPGSSASLIGPRVAANCREQDEVAARLLGAANQLLTERQVRLAQVLIDREQRPHVDWYRSAGYDAVILLDFLVRVVDGGLKITEYDARRHVDWVAYHEGTHDRFVRVLEQTYVESRDCDVLNGIRDPEDVLAGHRAVGHFKPELWRLLRVHGQDAGCLLLADHPAEDQCELVYLGLVPAFRGVGLGLATTYEALRLTVAYGRSRLVLAVDAKNEPAQRMYAKANFVCWARRQAQLRIFSVGA